MNPFWFLLLIPALIRGIIIHGLKISPFFGANFSLILPDLIFCSLVIFWFFKIKKLKFGFPLFIYFLSFIGSIIWDYQNGYYVLKFFFPVILFLILNQSSIEKITLRGIFHSAFFLIFFPLIYVLKTISKTVFNEQPHVSGETVIGTKKDEPNSLKSALILAGVVGVILGVIILAAITGLDPEFGKFLNLEKIWEIAGDSIQSGIYYAFAIFWFFKIPFSAKWDLKEYSSSFLRLMQGAVTIIVAIIIGYSIYDAYILLRAFKLITLVFESMGKNTQVYFLELVFLGGGLMYAGSYLIAKLQFHEKENRHARQMNLILIATLFFLIPPVFNILRALLNVYIPAFGLTSVRLFGIETTIAFVAAYAVILWGYFKKQSLLFTKSLLGFILPLIFLSFVLPNNLIVANWHFSKYMRGKPTDFDYFRKIRLEKWGGIFLWNLSKDVGQRSQDNRLVASDMVWGLLLARQTRFKKYEDYSKIRLINFLARETDEIQRLMIEQKFGELMKKYGDPEKKWWVYEGKPIENIRINQKSLAIDKEIEDRLNEEKQLFKGYRWDSNLHYPIENKLQFELQFEGENSSVFEQKIINRLNKNNIKAIPIIKNNIVINRNFYLLVRLYAGQRNGSSLIKITNDVPPFWIANPEENCVASKYERDTCVSFYSLCGKSYSALTQYPSMPEGLVLQYFEQLASKPSCGR